MAGRLQGKVAVITGGASGMGAAGVRRFIEEGASVVYCDRNKPEEAPHEDGVFVEADVTDRAALEAVITTAVDLFGGLDIMWNNAGIGGGEGSIVDCPEDVWDRTIAVDLKAVWLGIKLAAPHIVARGGGSIVTTASISGLLGMAGQGAYGAAKGGVIQLTRVAAIELAAQFVRVNCICPGGILTPILYANPSLPTPIDPEMMRGMLQGAQPIPRAGLPDDIANCALYLASDEASFVTGQAIPVDGGITAEFDARMRGMPAIG